jgi:hypothetical protein
MSELSAKQRIAVQLIAQGWPRGRIADELDIDPGTISRWRHEPKFCQLLDTLMDHCEQETLLTLRGMKFAAVERLAALMESPEPRIALKAVEIVLAKTDLRFFQ